MTTLPMNPAALIGHHVTFTAAAAAAVPAFDTLTIREVTAYHGIISGDPMYTVTTRGGEEHEAFLSELRIVGLQGPELARMLKLVQSFA